MVSDTAGLNRSRFCDNSHLAEIEITENTNGIESEKKPSVMLCFVSYNSHFAEEALLMFPG